MPRSKTDRKTRKKTATAEKNAAGRGQSRGRGGGRAAMAYAGRKAVDRFGVRWGGLPSTIKIGCEKWKHEG